MADRFKPLEMSQPVRFLHLRMNWRASLIILALLAVILLPFWGSVVARIQSSTFPYPGLQMDFNALAVDRLDTIPTYRNLTVTATFEDIYSYGGKSLLKVAITIHDSTTVTIEKFIDIKTRQEYVSVTAGGGSMVVSAAVYTVLWLPKDALPGQMLGINSFIGQLEGPVTRDAFGKRVPGSGAYVVRTAEGSFYYTLDTRVLELYESNVELTAAPIFPSPTPLRSIELMAYNDVAARGTMQGFLASVGVLLAVVFVFYLHHDIDRRRKARLEGLHNRIRSLSDILEDQYLLGFISRENYMRRQVVLRRLATEIEVEAQARRNNENNVPISSQEDFPAP